MVHLSRKWVSSKEDKVRVKAESKRTYKQYLYILYRDARDTREILEMAQRVYG